MKRLHLTTILTLFTLVLATPAIPQPIAAAQPDIVVVARRSGIPVWEVRSAAAMLILVGDIQGVTRSTRWDPEPITEAMRMADRVMFPAAVEISVSPFSMIGYLVKFRRHATLPNGQLLASMLSADDLRRLKALERRGLIDGPIERQHPFHLARQLREAAAGREKTGQGVFRFVRETVSKHNLEQVPIARGKVKPLADDLFASPPAAHLPCLRAAIQMAEAGPTAVRARSEAWAERRIQDVLASPAHQVYRTCWPVGTSLSKDAAAAVAPTLRRLLTEPRVTLAILSLDALAERGGLLDQLEAAGHEISGPAWK